VPPVWAVHSFEECVVIHRDCKALRFAGVLVPAAAAAALLGGCGWDNWMDPSQTGYFESTPTSMPVLTRLDVIETKVNKWGGPVEPPLPEDLAPSDIAYRVEPGDIIRVEIYELVAAGQTSVNIRRVEQDGSIRLPTLFDVPVGGLTIPEIQEEIEKRLEGLIRDPLVTVTLEEGRSYRYILYGAIGNPGVYSLTRPDFRLLEAIALASGTLNTTERVYVMRDAALDESLQPRYRQPRERGADLPTTPRTPTAPVDIESLIEQLDRPSPGATGSLFRMQDAPPIDIEDLMAPVRAPQRGGNALPPGATVAPPGPAPGDQWVYDAERQEWMRLPATGGPAVPGEVGEPADGAPLYAVRVIEIDYQRLKRGDSTQNIVIRPGDYIFVDPPESGLVYIGGNIARPGPYDLPTVGRLTLSRLVTAAGEFNGIAVPSRVDLVRKIGPNREATIRVNVAAIRNRAEPDIVMREGDHVIVGTTWWATPLAVVRNGFRVNYGFGFLLDRNFGNDVFGPPPEARFVVQ